MAVGDTERAGIEPRHVLTIALSLKKHLPCLSASPPNLCLPFPSKESLPPHPPNFLTIYQTKNFEVITRLDPTNQLKLNLPLHPCNSPPVPRATAIRWHNIPNQVESSFELRASHHDSSPRHTFSYVYTLRVVDEVDLYLYSVEDIHVELFDFYSFISHITNPKHQRY